LAAPRARARQLDSPSFSPAPSADEESDQPRRRGAARTPVRGGLSDPDPKQKGRNARMAKLNRDRKRQQIGELELSLSEVTAQRDKISSDCAALEAQLETAQAEILSLRSLLEHQSVWGSLIDVVTASDKFSIRRGDDEMQLVSTNGSGGSGGSGGPTVIPLQINLIVNPSSSPLPPPPSYLIGEP
jgi:hypothetical protein